MDDNAIKEIKKRKARWVGFFAVAILAASMGNIINCFYLLTVLRTLYLDPMTSEALKQMALNVAAATGIATVCLLVYFLRLPKAVQQWEYKEWGGKFIKWFIILSVIALPLPLLITQPSRGFPVYLSAYLLLEGVALNFLVAWYFSRSKIKSIFIR
ncbi:MAG: hypothetical protein HY587_03910 [Candidatus Omnitrophica bacterium]|nr:hypothetical protein [Candidatus Omnitrophota bacterium]